MASIMVHIACPSCNELCKQAAIGKYEEMETEGFSIQTKEKFSAVCENCNKDFDIIITAEVEK